MKTAGVPGAWSAPRSLLEGDFVVHISGPGAAQHHTHALLVWIFADTPTGKSVPKTRKKTENVCLSWGICEARFWCLKLESFLAGKYLIKSVNN